MAWGEPVSWTTVGGEKQGGTEGSYWSATNQAARAANAASYTPAKVKTKINLPAGWRERDQAGLEALLDTLHRYPSSYDTASSMMQVTQQLENLKTGIRETEVRGILDEIIGMYAPGGDFGKGTEAMIEREKEKSIAQGTQALVSSGLYGTTMAAGLGKKFEEEVGMPTRLKLEDVRYGQYSAALGQKAGMVERIEQEPIDYAMLAQMMQTGASA